MSKCHRKVVEISSEDSSSSSSIGLPQRKKVQFEYKDYDLKDPYKTLPIINRRPYIYRNNIDSSSSEEVVIKCRTKIKKLEVSECSSPFLKKKEEFSEREVIRRKIRGEIVSCGVIKAIKPKILVEDSSSSSE
jgi:hypothetical protein